MRTKIAWVLAVCISLTWMGCDSVSYKKNKAGWVYKIIPGNSKDSLVKMNNVVKMNFIRKLNDSVIYSSYGKMPAFIQANFTPGTDYNPFEVLFEMKKGDSVELVEMMDTLLKRGFNMQLPNAKKGDRLKTYLKILEVYRNDSIARIDYNAEMEKDRPRQEKEMKESQAKMAEEAKIQFQKEMEELKKSGEMDKQIKEMETFLASKKITARKAEMGTFVIETKKGDGVKIDDGKFVTVNYTGKHLNDSVFQTNTYIFDMGAGGVIRGWEDGIRLLSKGSKGTLYIPAYLAYGKNPQEGSPFKPNEPLIFDVEIVNVSDTQEMANADKQKADSIAAAKKPAPVKK